jgi:hypothetical protein
MESQHNRWTNSWWFSGIVILAFLYGITTYLVNYPEAWKVLSEVLDKVEWPLIVLISVLVLKEPLNKLLLSLGNNLNRIRGLSIGENFTFTSEELVSALVDREVLKTIIKVAMAYDGIGEKEELYLINRASPMKDHLLSLDDVSKLQVIDEAINIALMDDEIQNPEYSVILDVAEHYGLKPKQIEDLVMKACFARKAAKPPTLLREKFEKEYGKLVSR